MASDAPAACSAAGSEAPRPMPRHHQQSSFPPLPSQIMLPTGGSPPPPAVSPPGGHSYAAAVAAHAVAAGASSTSGVRSPLSSHSAHANTSSTPVLSNTLPDLLFLLEPEEHAGLMDLLRARIDGRPAGRLAVIEDALPEATPSFAGGTEYGAAAPPISASAAAVGTASPSGPSALGVARERSKSLSLRAGLAVRRPSLQSVSEEGGAAAAMAGGITGMLLPHSEQLDEESRREAMLRAIAASNTTGSSEVAASSSTSRPSSADPPIVAAATHRSMGSISGAVAGVPADHRRNSLSVGQGGLIALPSNWSRQGSNISTSASIGTDDGDGGEGGDTGDSDGEEAESSAGAAPDSMSEGQSPVAHERVVVATGPHMLASSLARSASAAALLDSSSRSSGQHHATIFNPLLAQSAHYPPSMSPPERAQSAFGEDMFVSSASTGGVPVRRLGQYQSVGAQAGKANPLASPLHSPRGAPVTGSPGTATGGGNNGPFDPETEENGGQYWSLSHASLLLERIALEKMLSPQFSTYLASALESIATARAIVAQRINRRVALEEKLKAHPSQVADWLAEFATGETDGQTSAAASAGGAGGARAKANQGQQAKPLASPKRIGKMSELPPGAATLMLPTATSSSRCVSEGSMIPASAAPGSVPVPVTSAAAASVMAALANAAAASSSPSSTLQPGTIVVSPTTAFAAKGSSTNSPTNAAASAAAAAAAAAAGTPASHTDSASGIDASSALMTPASEALTLSGFERALLRDPVSSLLTRSLEWDFELFEFHAATGDHALLYLSNYLLRELGLRDAFPHLDEKKFFRFFVDIERGYNHAIPYHTDQHGADVMQGMAYFMRTPVLRSTLSPLDVLAGLVAAACHDYEHLGRNNAFMVATGHRLALLYNDTSVMESHHASASWNVLLRPENNFLESFSTADRGEFRAAFLSAILHTDMSMHTRSVAEFDASVKHKRTHQTWFSPTSKEDRRLLLDMACHISDLGNPAKPAHLAREWTRRVVEEFWQQGDAEKAHGLKVSPMMDREKAAVDAQQFGFIDFVVGPSVNLWADALGPESIAPVLENLSANKAYYKSRIAPPPASAPPVAVAAATPVVSVSSGSPAKLRGTTPQPHSASTAATVQPAATSSGGAASSISSAASAILPAASISLLQVIPSSSLQVSPWKNGGGRTRQLLIWPPTASLAADDFTWRLSSASVEASAAPVPFSQFPGRQRILTVLGSRGMRLRLAGEASSRVLHPLLAADDAGADQRALERFDGSVAASAELLGNGSAPVEDLGLIFRDSAVRVDAHVQRLAALERVRLSPLRAHQQAIVVLVRGSVDVVLSNSAASSGAATLAAQSSPPAPAATASAAAGQANARRLAEPLDCCFVADAPTALSLALEIIGQAAHSVVIVFLLSLKER